MSYVALGAKWEGFVGQGGAFRSSVLLSTICARRGDTCVARFFLLAGEACLAPTCALGHLARHPLAGGRWHYRGSLLNAVISVPDAFWQAQPLWRAQVSVVIASALRRIHKVAVPEDFETELRAAMPRFT